MLFNSYAAALSVLSHYTFDLISKARPRSPRIFSAGKQRSVGAHVSGGRTYTHERITAHQKFSSQGHRHGSRRLLKQKCILYFCPKMPFKPLLSQSRAEPARLIDDLTDSGDNRERERGYSNGYEGKDLGAKENPFVAHFRPSSYRHRSAVMRLAIASCPSFFVAPAPITKLCFRLKVVGPI